MWRIAATHDVPRERSGFVDPTGYPFSLFTGSVSLAPQIGTSDYPLVTIESENPHPWLAPLWDIFLWGAQYNTFSQFEKLLAWEDSTGRSFIKVRNQIVLLLRDVRSQNVEIPNLDEVVEYLLRFSDIIDVVKVAIPIARRYLSEAQLSLEVYHDPEISDDHLVLYARFREYSESVLAAIEHAESEYLPLLAHKSGWFILTTDFRRLE